MPGRMSSLHSPVDMTGGISLPPLSANGDTPNTINGATINLHGRRGVVFTGLIGALTGAANVAFYLQTNNVHGDPDNGTWSNVNSTTYPNAAVAAKTNANSAWELSYTPASGGSPVVRCVRTVAANVALASVSHIVY